MPIQCQSNVNPTQKPCQACPNLTSIQCQCSADTMPLRCRSITNLQTKCPSQTPIRCRYADTKSTSHQMSIVDQSANPIPIIDQSINPLRIPSIQCRTDQLYGSTANPLSSHIEDQSQSSKLDRHRIGTDHANPLPIGGHLCRGTGNKCTTGGPTEVSRRRTI